MNDLERFRATMDYGKVDRAPFYEFMWPTWPETADRWAREGGYIAGQTDFRMHKSLSRKPVDKDPLAHVGRAYFTGVVLKN